VDAAGEGHRHEGGLTVATAQPAQPSRRFDDFEVGQVFQTYRRTVTETDLVNFTQFAGLRLPIFLDDEYAKRSPHGGRIVPGFLTASVSAGMLESVLGEHTIAGLGMDAFRFKLAVRPGDTLGADITVTQKKATKDPTRGVLTVHVQVTNQTGAVVLEYSTTVLMAR
jgi:acyl dehydratase